MKAFLNDHEEEADLRIDRGHRSHDQAHDARRVLDFDSDVVAHDLAPTRPGSAQGQPQLVPEASAERLEQVRHGHRARRKLQVAADRPGEEQDVATLVDDRRWARVFVAKHTLERGADLLLRRGRAGSLESVPLRLPGLVRIALRPERGNSTIGRVTVSLRRKIAISLVHRLEQLRASGDALGGTEEQKAAGSKRVVEQRNELLLQLGAEVDEDVAAGDEVELRERRIADQAVLGEDAHLAQLLDRLVGLPLSREEAREPLGRHVLGDVRGVAAMARLSEHLRVEVGREDLHEALRLQSLEVLAQQDGDGVGLLARGAAGDPDADRRVGGLALHDAGKDLLGQGLERVGVAEELGHADQEILEQTFRLRGVLLQELQVVLDRVQVRDLQPAPNAPQQGPLFVAAEVVPGALVDQRADRAEVGGELLVEFHGSMRTSELGKVLRVLGQLGGHLLDRDNVVDQPGADGALGHAVVLGGLRRLRQGEAAALLDRRGGRRCRRGRRPKRGCRRRARLGPRRASGRRRRWARWAQLRLAPHGGPPWSTVSRVPGAMT